MQNRRSFKSDESFLEKIAIGAVGTKRIIEDLRDNGHNPIELERGSTSFKIWKSIKIKRIRVPDILCIDCAICAESRAKTGKLEISMSHSHADPKRAWDYGLEDNDFVALAVCERAGDRPIDWQADNLVQYIPVKSLRAAYAEGQTVSARQKGSQEGFEDRITWLASVASAAGVVTRTTSDKLQYRRSIDNRLLTLNLVKQGIKLRPLVVEGDSVLKNQVVASSVSVLRSFPCPKTSSEENYIQMIKSTSLSERFAAAKALSHFESPKSTEYLAQKIGDEKEHIFVRLEAAAGLSRREDERGSFFIKSCLIDPFLENRLEAVIVLGEISTDGSVELLMQTLTDTGENSEIRAGAAWALGELKSHVSMGILIESFLNVEEAIRVEAARALAKLADRHTPLVLTEFSESDPLKRPGIAWALAHAGKASIEQLLDVLVDDDARLWVSFIIGSQDKHKFLQEIERLRPRDPEVYFAVTVLWQIMNSWIYGLEEF